MKTTFYLNGKKTTRKAVTELISAERLERYTSRRLKSLSQKILSLRTASGLAAGTHSPSNSTDTAFKSTKK